jgi:pimeloyl-ACP methyl ester carboxylesterase
LDAIGASRFTMAAFERLGIEQPVVVGHLMGTMVAMAIPDHPTNVRSLAGIFLSRLSR